MLSRYVVEHECGLHVLAAGDEFGRPGQRDVDAVEQTLRALNSIYDYVILDVGTSLMMPAAARCSCRTRSCSWPIPTCRACGTCSG